MVKSLICSLHKRGETTYDLLINIKKGYMACEDNTFCKCISDMFDRFKNNNTNELILNALMVRGANKFK